MDLRIAGGSCFFMSSALGFLNLTVFKWGLKPEEIPAWVDISEPTFYFTCMVIYVVASAIALMGSYITLAGKDWGRALLFGIFSTMTLGIFYSASIIGLVGFILVYASKNDPFWLKSAVRFSLPPALELQ
jgi:hypothetical protein